MNSILATPTKIGAYNLRNRIVMAPLTRMRADKNFALTELTAEYYRQRATSGLIIAEASQITQQGQGYPFTPGIYSKEQILGWNRVTKAVHAEGGLIFLQLWHVGRLSHHAHQPNRALPVAPSAIAATGHAYLPDYSRENYEVPRALTIDEIKNIVEDYRKAAINAKEAGFDGIELHGANGYLIEQFLRTVSNQRADEYGGSIENRSKFLFEVLEAVLSIWGNEKTAIRLSPFGTGNIPAESEPYPIYDYVVQKLETYQLAYLHIVETKEMGPTETGFDVEQLYVKYIRSFYSSPIIAAGNFNKERAESVIEKGHADAVAFGRHYISTPDLAFRLINGIEPNESDPSTFYGGGSKGYTDYSTY